MRRFWFGLLMVAVTLPAFAGNISVSGAWLRLLPGNLPLAGYAYVTNTGTRPLTLVAANSPEFSEVQLHRSMQRNGMDVMSHLDSIGIAAGKSLDFAPGGYHLMLFNRKHPLHVGQQVPVTLIFSDGAHFTAVFLVKGAAGQ
ncbi:MAG: copper chaperone PCu(A)C [Gammaproteobacteria bacterium]